MDNTESLALKYLESLNLGPITFEPDGNVPPDFLIDRRIAVEVRRLNEHWENSEGELEGVEKDQYLLTRLIKRLIVQLGPPVRGESWFICYRFCRPLVPVRDLSCAIHEYLVQFRDGLTEETKFSVDQSVHVKLLRASQVHSTYFVFGGASDDDSGGFLRGLLEKNIRICVEEKRRKIAHVRDKYPEWWLVLIDRVSYGMWESISIPHDWDKVILVDPQDPHRNYALKNSSIGN